MELTIKGDALKSFLTLARSNDKVARALARQWMKELEPDALNAYLLYSADVAADLLAQRFTSDPEGTLAVMRRLPARTSPLPGKRRGRPPGPAKKATKATKATKARKPGRPRKRRRYTAKEIEGLKQQILDFITKHPNTTRKQLHDAISFPTLAIYHRVMGELRDGKQIRSKGDRSKTVYNVRKKPGRKKK